MAKSKKVKPIVLPDGFADIGHVTVPEFMPNQRTMDRFDREPWTLWQACNEWWETLRHNPHIMDPEYQIGIEFTDLTEALMLYASTHGLGSGMELADAAAGGDIWRARSFLDAMRNRAQLGTPSPTEQPTAAQAPARAKPTDNRGLTVREVARDHLRVNTGKVYGWIRRGELKAMNTSTDPKRKRWIITQEALAEFQARRQPQSPPKLPPTRRKRQAGTVDFYP
jgi:hypothetical protein